jgi:hypothetical protein
MDRAANAPPAAASLRKLSKNDGKRKLPEKEL